MAVVRVDDYIEVENEEIIELNEKKDDKIEELVVNNIEEVVREIGPALFQDLKDAETGLWNFLVKEDRKRKRRCQLLRNPIFYLLFLLFVMFMGLIAWVVYLSHNCKC